MTLSPFPCPLLSCPHPHVPQFTLVGVMTEIPQQLLEADRPRQSLNWTLVCCSGEPLPTSWLTLVTGPFLLPPGLYPLFL